MSGKINGLDALPYFNRNTGFPAVYMSKDFNTFSVARYSSLLAILALNSFLVSTILIASLSYIGMWKFFRLIIGLYPQITRPVFFLILALPSLLFWEVEL